MIRVVFAGTPAFARESLQALLRSGTRPLAVLTQPDRPAGRGKKLTQSPVKSYAIAEGLDVWQPESLKDPGVVAELDALAADLFIVAAYGLLLPRAILALPRVASVNVHASLLPRWRGAAPIQAAILAGDEETGISLMQMEAGLDTGPVYAESALRIGRAESAGELHDRLAVLGGALLVEHLDAIASGHLPAIPQDDAQATVAPKIRTADAAIDWRQPAEQILRVVRAYNPVPGAWTMLHGERLKCWSAVADVAIAGEPGDITDISAAGIGVACGHGGVRLTSLQRPGRNPVTAAELAAQLTLPGQAFRSQ